MRISRCRSAFRVASLAALAVVLTHVPSHADSAAVDDAADSLRPVDIARVTASHTDAGRFSYRIDTYAPFRRRAAPCLSIRAGRPVHDNFRICGDGRIVDEQDAATGRRASVTRPTRSSITYAFSREAIGGPSWHSWRAIVRGSGCPHAVCDAAPDRGWVVHATTVRFERWAERFLREMKVPRCRNNEVVVLAWEANENTEAVFNPLATTRDMPRSWDFNPVGVQNYLSLAQGLDASRLTIENGFEIYGYGAIVRRLERCSAPMSTARAIRDSRWCFGCSGGAYVTGVVRSVKNDFRSYADRTISTAP
ncbi:MAG TPA: hypothetical protein VIG53_04005 [Actinomycetota bacterium]